MNGLSNCHGSEEKMVKYQDRSHINLFHGVQLSYYSFPHIHQHHCNLVQLEQGNDFPLNCLLLSICPMNNQAKAKPKETAIASLCTELSGSEHYYYYYSFKKHWRNFIHPRLMHKFIYMLRFDYIITKFYGPELQPCSSFIKHKMVRGLLQITIHFSFSTFLP